MNDIEKAMAFLREERRLRVEALSATGEGAIEMPALAPASRSSDIARSAETAAEVRSASLPRNARIGRDLSSAVIAPEPSTGQETRPRSRFDDELFADDVLDGIGTRSSASDRTGSASDTVSGASAGATSRDPASGGTETATDPAALDMPELGIVSAPFVEDGAPDVAGASATDHAPVEAASEIPLREPGVTRPMDVATADDAARPIAGGAFAPPARERSVSLPLKRLARRGFLTPGAGKGRLSEEFRRVKRPILRNIADAAETDGHRNVVMITSSVAGEGKTYTAINLAMSLAVERERTVLLVDADVLKGSAGAVLGIAPDRPGLVDVLDDERLDIADVMLATDVPDLRFVPAGRRDEHTTELLSSPRMSDLIDELARRYADRVIVLDCPPILQTNEANVIADHAGQVVFVVAGQETDQRLVLEAMRRFDENTSVGVLLNKASGSSAAYGYDYGYNYG